MNIYDYLEHSSSGVCYFSTLYLGNLHKRIVFRSNNHTTSLNVTRTIITKISERNKEMKLTNHNECIKVVGLAKEILKCTLQKESTTVNSDSHVQKSDFKYFEGIFNPVLKVLTKTH